MTNRNLPTAYSASETASRVLQSARAGWGLGETVTAGGVEGLVVGMSCVEPAAYLVQFADMSGKWFAHEEVASAARI